MNRFVRFAFCALLTAALWSGPPAAAQAPQAAAPAAPAVGVTEFEVNGAKVLFKRRPGSRTVAAGVFFRGGASNLTAETAGLEMLLLNVMKRGSEKFPRERLRGELARMASAIGSGSNYDYSALTLACTREHFPRSWEIFTDLLQRPTLSPEDLNLERERIQAALKSETDHPDSALERRIEQMIFAGHPYRNRPEGSPETLASFTVADLRRHHQQVLAGTRLLVVIVGDLEPADVRARVSASLAGLLRGNYQLAPVPALQFTAPALDIIRRDVPTNYVQGVFAAPNLASADMPALRIAVSILRERIFDEVREKRSLSYAPDAFLKTNGANYGGIYVSTQDANRSVGVMLDEITRLQTEPVREREVSSAVAEWTTAYYAERQSNSEQAGELAQFELIGGGWRRSLELAEQLRKVTPADVQRVAQKYIRNLQFVALGNPSQFRREIFIGASGQ
jgi:predicted Zn-dependent peptidase